MRCSVGVGSILEARGYPGPEVYQMDGAEMQHYTFMIMEYLVTYVYLHVLSVQEKKTAALVVSQ